MLFILSLLKRENTAVERPDWETNWQPISLDDVAAIFQGYPGRWWLAGGWAIDLFAGEPFRDHSDIDADILRSDKHLIHDVLPGWEIYACQYPGVQGIRLWSRGESLPDVVHDLWCRPAPDAPWALQLMLLDDEGDDWIYRRDRRIRGAIDTLTVKKNGMPLLAPEVQLLFKSRGHRPKDKRDFHRALPLLDDYRRQWLIDALTVSDPNNPWLSKLLEEENFR